MSEPKIGWIINSVILEKFLALFNSSECSLITYIMITFFYFQKHTALGHNEVRSHSGQANNTVFLQDNILQIFWRYVWRRGALPFLHTAHCSSNVSNRNTFLPTAQGTPEGNTSVSRLGISPIQPYPSGNSKDFFPPQITILSLRRALINTIFFILF